MVATSSVSLKHLADTMIRAINSGKYDRARLDRAAMLVITGAVTKVSEHEYRVASQTAPDTFYRVTPSGCGCMDALRRPSDRCKHDLATRLVLSAEIAEARAQFTPAELERLAKVKARREQVSA